MADRQIEIKFRRLANRVGRCQGGFSAFLALLGLMSAAQPAHAYLDLGTGSILLQMLLGGVAGAVVIAKLYWYRIKAFFGRGDSEPTSTDAEGPAQQNPAE